MSRRLSREHGSTTPLEVTAVTPRDWEKIEKLFGARGACGGCWCMWWRIPHGGKLWEQSKGEPNRVRLHALVEAGQVHAVLAMHAADAVGWCCFGPRSTFPRLETVKALRTHWQASTWSVVCFFIPPKWRGRGVATQLLRAATAQAFSLGADEIEAYPVVAKQRGTMIPSAFAWTGVPSLFARCGYEPLDVAPGSRPILVAKRTELASRT